MTKIVGYETNDKLNHAYAFGGVKMSMDTIETLLDIPLDHYVSINMRGLKDLIDAVGGIEVNNKIDFTLDGIHVPKGKQTLDGEKGLPMRGCVMKIRRRCWTAKTSTRSSNQNFTKSDVNQWCK